MDLIYNFSNLFNDVWSHGIGGASFNKIGLSTFIFIFFLLLRGLFSKFIVNRIEIFVSKPTNNFDKKLVFSLKAPIKFFPIVLGFFLASSIVGFEGKASSFVDNVNRSLITIMIFWFIHQIIEPISFLIKKIEYLLSKDLLNWIVSAIKIFILILGFAAVLELWGIKIGPIIAGLGLFGVAVALGAQDLFKNLISGILVLIEKRFKVGDVINVENVIEGVVEKISFRSTSVRRFDKSLCTIPNFQFAENAVTNISEITNRRINWVIGLEYGSTVDQLKKIKNDIYNFIENSEFFFISDSTRPIVRIDQFSDSSIDILVRCFIKTNDYDDWLKAKDKLAIGIKEIVEKNEAGFAFPSQSIYIEKNN